MTSVEVMNPLADRISPWNLSQNLFLCRRLRGLKGLPGIPSALPILFLGPTLRFQEMKIGRRVRPFAKMTGCKERLINPTVLHLRTIKFVTNGLVIVRGLEALFRILKRKICGDSRQRHWLTVLLGQLVAGAK